MSSAESQPDASPLFCARCSVQLHPGQGNFFQVTIDAVADPSPPVCDAPESPAELRRQIEETLAKLSRLSAREAMDQVHRRLVLHLCDRCFHAWIEHPTFE